MVRSTLGCSALTLAVLCASADAERDRWQLVSRQPSLYVLRGDLNHDGKVDSADVGIMVRSLARGAKTGAFPQELDLNRDGEVDQADLVWLMEEISGVRREAPRAGPATPLLGGLFHPALAHRFDPVKQAAEIAAANAEQPE